MPSRRGSLNTRNDLTDIVRLRNRYLRSFEEGRRGLESWSSILRRNGLRPYRTRSRANLRRANNLRHRAPPANRRGRRGRRRPQVRTRITAPPPRRVRTNVRAHVSAVTLRSSDTQSTESQRDSEHGVVTQDQNSPVPRTISNNSSEVQLYSPQVSATSTRSVLTISSSSNESEQSNNQLGDLTSPESTHSTINSSIVHARDSTATIVPDIESSDSTANDTGPQPTEAQPTVSVDWPVLAGQFVTNSHERPQNTESPRESDGNTSPEDQNSETSVNSSYSTTAIAGSHPGVVFSSFRRTGVRQAPPRRGRSTVEVPLHRIQHVPAGIAQRGPGTELARGIAEGIRRSYRGRPFGTTRGVAYLGPLNIHMRSPEAFGVTNEGTIHWRPARDIEREVEREFTRIYYIHREPQRANATDVNRAAREPAAERNSEANQRVESETGQETAEETTQRTEQRAVGAVANNSRNANVCNGVGSSSGSDSNLSGSSGDITEEEESPLVMAVSLNLRRPTVNSEVDIEAGGDGLHNNAYIEAEITLTSGHEDSDDSDESEEGTN